jgi:RecB family exonuclease
MTMPAFSYSSIKTFEQCPKKYYHLKEARDVHDEPGEAANYGSAVHLAAEHFVTEGKPIPPKYSFMSDIVAALTAFPGERHAEVKLGLRKEDDGTFTACDFDDPDAWYRGIADLLIVNGITAVSVDYKTGKSSRYADLKQLDLLAGAVFTHFPEVMVIKSALIFVVAGDLVDKTHVRTEKSQYLSVFDEQLRRLATARRTGVWNTKDGPLCGWCPVESCPHWYQAKGRK